MRRLVFAIGALLFTLLGFAQTTKQVLILPNNHTRFGVIYPTGQPIILQDSSPAHQYQLTHANVLVTDSMTTMYRKGWVVSVGTAGAGISGTVFQYEISIDAQNNIIVPFTLRSTSLVFYNSQIISGSRWSGAGTTILNVILDTRKNDKLIIQM